MPPATKVGKPATPKLTDAEVEALKTKFCKTYKPYTTEADEHIKASLLKAYEKRIRKEGRDMTDEALAKFDPPYVPPP